MYHAKCAGLLRVPKGAFICPAHEPPAQPSINVGQQLLSRALGVDVETIKKVSAAYWDLCKLLSVTFSQLIKDGMPVVSVEGCS